MLKVLEILKNFFQEVFKQGLGQSPKVLGLGQSPKVLGLGQSPKVLTLKKAESPLAKNDKMWYTGTGKRESEESGWNNWRFGN